MKTLRSFQLKFFPAMPAQLTSRLVFWQGSCPLLELPPAFLAPVLHFPLVSPASQFSKFSTSFSVSRDLNRQRGVSAIHRSGPRQKLSVSEYPLPQPVSP